MKSRNRFILGLAPVVLASSLLGLTSASAATYSWQTAGTTNVWSTDGADANWFIDAGNTLSPWVDANDAAFSGASGETVTLTGSLAPVTTTVGAGNGNWTFSGTGGITSGTLTKIGTGTLTLSNTNTYTGGTVLSAGTLQWATGGALGSAGTITIGDANTGATNVSLLGTTASTTLARNVTVTNLGSGTVTIGGIQPSGGFATNYSGTLTLNRAVTLTSPTGADRTDFSGNITGNVGTLTIAGGGRTVFVTTSKTFTGDVALTGTGTSLQIGVVTGGVLDQIPNGSSVTVGTGASLRLSALGEEFGGLNGTGTVNSNSAPAGGVFTIGSQNLGGSFSGSIGSGGTGLGITKIGSGTQVLSGAGTYTGRTSVNGGTLSLAFGAVSTNILGSTSALTLGGGNLNLTGTGTQTVNGLTTTANTGSKITLGANQTLTLGALTAAGVNSTLNVNTIAGGANGAAVGTGTVVLTGQTPGSLINPGFTVSDVGGFGFATVDASNQIIRLTTTPLLPASDGIPTIDYQVDNNAGGNTAAGSSNLIVTASQGVKSVTVDTSSSAGTLTLNSGVVFSGNTWNFGGNGTNTYQITGSAGGAGLTATASNDALSFNNYNGGSVTIASPILANGANSVYFNGPGTTILGALNTYTGTTFVNEGTLNLNSGGGTGAIRGALTIASGATVNVTAASGLGTTQNQRVGNIAINGGTLHMANTGNNAATSVGITFNGGSLTGIPTSKLDLRNNGAGSTSVITNAAATTATISVPTLGLPGNTATFTTARGTTLSGIDLLISSNIVNNAGTGGVAGGNSIIKAGLGTLSLTGTNSYTGDTTVNAGTLALGSTGSIANSPKLTIAAGARLDTTATASYTLPAAVTLGVGAAGSSGRIDATGKDLVISSANVTFTGTPTSPAYVLANYGTLTGATFASVTLPPGYAIDYAFNGEPQIALVQSLSGFDFWIATNYPGLSDKTPGGDPDNDGTANLVEFVLNGNPSLSDPAILPALNASGSTFVFNFNRLDESLGNTVLTFQYGSDLAGWTDVVVPEGGGPVGAATITVTPGTPADGVSISIPKTEAGVTGKLFGRLKVTQP